MSGLPSVDDSRDISYRAAIREAISDAMAADRSIVVLGEDIGCYGGAFGVTKGLLQQYGPERIIDTPMSEAALVGIGTGAALMGMRPIVELMFMDFVTLAMDQLVNHATKYPYIYGDQAKVPLVIRTASGGWRGYGATHSQSLEAWLLHVPGLIVAVPSTPGDAYGLMMNALTCRRPVVFMEHKLLYRTRCRVPSRMDVLPFGEAAVRREGNDVTVVTYSYLSTQVLQVAEDLSNEGIEVEVIDPRTLCPLDISTLCKSVAKTGKVLLVEEGTEIGGVGGEIAFQIQLHVFGALKKPMLRVAADNCPIPCAPRLEADVLPSKRKIAQAIRSLVR